MTVRMAINGFGRIGRLLLRRTLSEGTSIQPVAINASRGSPEALAWLFKHDSIFGRWQGEVAWGPAWLEIDGRRIAVLNQPDLERLSWTPFDVDVVAESTGVLRTRAAASAHLRAGAGRVVVAAPVDGADATLVCGVNDDAFDPLRHRVVSAASCTTNCVAPLALVLHQRFGIRSGALTTVHAYTRDQELNDAFHEDLRRARAATLNLIPTKTGAARAIEEVLPALRGRLSGLAVRVPVPDVSLATFAAMLDRPVTIAQVNDAFAAAAAGPLRGILGICDEPLVSSDFIGDDRSCVIDAPSTRVAGGNHVNVLAWYDNEWGYAARMADIIRLVSGASSPRQADLFLAAPA